MQYIEQSLNVSEFLKAMTENVFIVSKTSTFSLPPKLSAELFHPPAYQIYPKKSLKLHNDVCIERHIITIFAYQIRINLLKPTISAFQHSNPKMEYGICYTHLSFLPVVDPIRNGRVRYIYAMRVENARSFASQ